MTIIIPARGAEPSSRRRAFSLPELMIVLAISAFLLIAVISAFLFLSRSGLRVADYNDMEAQARTLLTQFGQDARQASDAQWNSSSSLTLTVGGAAVTYAYDATAQQFTRSTGGGTSTLATHITVFAYRAYDIEHNELALDDNLTAAGNATKLIDIRLQLARHTSSVAESTTQIVSASYVLRNKPVT